MNHLLFGTLQEQKALLEALPVKELHDIKARSRDGDFWSGYWGPFSFVQGCTHNWRSKSWRIEKSQLRPYCGETKPDQSDRFRTSRFLLPNFHQTSQMNWPDTVRTTSLRVSWGDFLMLSQYEHTTWRHPTDAPDNYHLSGICPAFFTWNQGSAPMKNV